MDNRAITVYNPVDKEGTMRQQTDRMRQGWTRSEVANLIAGPVLFVLCGVLVVIALAMP